MIGANDAPAASATDCSAMGACGEWLELGFVLSTNASTTACFTTEELVANSAVILTVINKLFLRRMLRAVFLAGFSA